MKQGYASGNQMLQDARQAAAAIISRENKATEEEIKKLKEIWDKVYKADGISRLYRYHIKEPGRNMLKKEKIQELTSLLCPIPDDTDWEAILAATEPDDDEKEANWKRTRGNAEGVEGKAAEKGKKDTQRERSRERDQGHGRNTSRSRVGPSPPRRGRSPLRRRLSPRRGNSRQQRGVSPRGHRHDNPSHSRGGGGKERTTGQDRHQKTDLEREYFGLPTAEGVKEVEAEAHQDDDAVEADHAITAADATLSNKKEKN
jgi:hypothetical protein